MQDRWYLLTLEHSKKKVTTNVGAYKEKMLQEAVRRLDGERRRKLEHCKSERKQLECIGAGVLLQLAVREALSEAGKAESADRMQFSITRCTFSQLLQDVQEPLPLEYFYGSHGKPYLKNYPFYFNISHSGKYVLCVLSEQDVGADIQWKASSVNERVLKRFFSPREKAYWESCSGESERRDFFYQMWCRKEAYGKLTGEGIGDAVSVNMYFPKLPIVIEEYCDLEDYQIAVCKWKRKEASLRS